MRLPNLLLKFQRCPARTTVTELHNTKTSKLTRPNLSWVLGGLCGNLHLCPCGKDINLAKGGLQSMSVLSPGDGCEVEGAACDPFLRAVWREPPNLPSSVFSAICTEGKILKL